MSTAPTEPRKHYKIDDWAPILQTTAELIEAIQQGPEVVWTLQLSEDGLGFGKSLTATLISLSMERPWKGARELSPVLVMKLTKDADKQYLGWKVGDEVRIDVLGNATALYHSPIGA